jgi:hypothetical protein
MACVAERWTTFSMLHRYKPRLDAPVRRLVTIAFDALAGPQVAVCKAVAICNIAV